MGALVLATPRGGSAGCARLCRQLGEQAIQVLGPGVPEAQRLARFRELFHNDFDLPGIGQFVLGRYWRTATPQQQQDFLGLFQEYHRARLQRPARRNTAASRSASPASARMATRRSSPARSFSSTGSRIEVDWYLTDHGRLKDHRCLCGGVSMEVTERDEFASVIQRNGGRLDGLIAQLRQKLAVAG